MTTIAGCIGINNKSENVGICGNLLRDLRKNPNWFVCQRGNEYGAIGSVGAAPETAHSGEWVLVLHGGPVWEKSGRVLSSRDILRRWVVDGIEKTISSLVGQFAFAVYNMAERKLWMYSDKSGANPIYYVGAGDRVAFSALPISLIDFLGEQLKVKKASLIGFMLGLPEELVGCLFVGQDVVPKGCLIEYDLTSGSEKHQLLHNAEFDGFDVLEKAVGGLKGKLAFCGNDVVHKVITSATELENILDISKLRSGFSPNEKAKYGHMSHSLFVRQVASVCQRPVQSPQSYSSYDAIIYSKRKNISYFVDFMDAPSFTSDDYCWWKRLLYELVESEYVPTVKIEGRVEYDPSIDANFAHSLGVSVLRGQVVLGDTSGWPTSTDTLKPLELPASGVFDEVKTRGQKIISGKGVSSFLYRANPLKDWFEENFYRGDVSNVNDYILLLRFVCLELWLETFLDRRNVKVY